MERLLVSGATELVRNLGSVVTQQIGMAWGVKDELEILERTLETIAAVTTDAEKQQEEFDLVRLWLKRLKDVVYDADDVMGEFSYEAMHRSKLCGTRNKFQIFTPDSYTRDRNSVQQNRLITSFVDESSVLGRDNDKVTIINMLISSLESSSSLSMKFSVVSVVGMGGIGKTTLAQMVYKDNLIKSFFDIRVWVCVSDDFNIKKILVKIIESVTSKKCDDISNDMVLFSKVREELNNKKYLLVLDDMWNEDAEDWDKLKGLLSVGDHGSKVLITTRSNVVASVVRDITSPYILKELTDYDWVIQKEILVRLWIAEGFIYPSHGGSRISLEDAGDDYFHSLLANSFFQDVAKNELGDIETCKMHDLVHDLAESVNGVHGIKTVNSSEMESISEFRRLHLVLDKKKFSNIFKRTLGKNKKIEVRFFT
ncbi:putative disease resistance protein RGA3 [Papaver somniferum]|uniref:putative disease resistance protein RGA3 n=1 Tax=Papaver somniferum TaxID=3469 RepID=UPI000E70098D|nr:putative disease resistance protein RGA3 [Papaver somniferum]